MKPPPRWWPTVKRYFPTPSPRSSTCCKKYGGVVPEIAARRHTELIGYVIKEALDTAGKTLDDVEAVAVTSRQGLIGCLMVGVAAAKSISYARHMPLIGVHHIEGHIFANRFQPPRICLFPTSA